MLQQFERGVATVIHVGIMLNFAVANGTMCAPLRHAICCLQSSYKLMCYPQFNKTEFNFPVLYTLSL